MSRVWERPYLPPPQLTGRRTFVEQPEAPGWDRRGGTGDREEDGGLVGRTGEDDVVVDSGTHQLCCVESVRHPHPAVVDMRHTRSLLNVDVKLFRKRLLNVYANKKGKSRRRRRADKRQFASVHQQTKCHRNWSNGF